MGPLSAHISSPQINYLHTTACLDIMAKELRFNMYKLPSSFVRNERLPDLKALSEANTSSRLRYACRHWADRVSQLETLDANLVGMLTRFFQAHFLHWLEVISILALSPVDILKNLVAIHVCNLLIFATMI